MKIEEKNEGYEAPAVEMIEVAVEKGFAISGDDPSGNPIDGNPDGGGW